MEPFLEALGRRVLVCDGAMGTMLYARGIFINRSFEALNLVEPDLVLVPGWVSPLKVPIPQYTFDSPKIMYLRSVRL